MRLRRCSVSAVLTLLLICLSMLVFNLGIPACSAVSLPIVINDGATYTNSTTVTLTLNAGALLPSVPSTAEMCISNDNRTWTSWEPYTTSKSWTLTSGDGLKTVYFRIRLDSTSPPSQAQFSIILDTVPPLLVLTSPFASDTVWESSSLQVDWRATDTGSGLSHTEVSLDNSPWIDVGTQTTYTFTGLSDGTHTFAIKAVDNAGNSQTTSKSVTVNIISPTPTSTSPEGEFTTWLIVGAVAAAAAIAVAAVIVFKRTKKPKGYRRD